MARHYPTRDFFQQMPNRLLARYFHARGVFDDLDFAAMQETQPDELFTAWLALDDAPRHTMDAEFRDIAELSCEKGCRAIIDEATWHLARDDDAHGAFVEQLATLPNHFERAMSTFLDHPDFWKVAALFYRADSLSYWRKRTHLPHVPAAVDDASLHDLASVISTFFHRTEGRGKNCVVASTDVEPCASGSRCFRRSTAWPRRPRRSTSRRNATATSPTWDSNGAESRRSSPVPSSGPLRSSAVSPGR